jgi:predicted O-methyltransferase YrrM
MLLARQFASDPIEAAIRGWSKFAERSEPGLPPCSYSPDTHWVRSLGIDEHDDAMIRHVWDDVVARLKGSGTLVGPASYGGHNDADPQFIRALWHLLKQPNAGTVVETGVAHGVTTRFVLEAFRRHQRGHLWSIDLPPPTMPQIHAQVGIAVTADLRRHWTYIRGSSQRRLRPLLRDLGTIDVFIHDSWHSRRNMLFEMRHAWNRLRGGGAMLIDDIDLNPAFDEFTRQIGPVHSHFVCVHAPAYPDPLREQRKQPGLFGIILKATP